MLVEVDKVVRLDVEVDVINELNVDNVASFVVEVEEAVFELIVESIDVVTFNHKVLEIIDFVVSTKSVLSFLKMILLKLSFKFKLIPNRSFKVIIFLFALLFNSQHNL